MNKVTPKSLQLVSHHLCHVFGIDMAADDLVLFIGNEDAIREWVDNQDGLENKSRREIAIELRDRLRDVLLDIETALRATS